MIGAKAPTLQIVEIEKERIYKINQELVGWKNGKMNISVSLLRNTLNKGKVPVQHATGYTLGEEKYYNITIAPDVTITINQTEVVNKLKETIVLDASNMLDMQFCLKEAFELLKGCDPNKLNKIYYYKGNRLCLTGYNDKIAEIKARYGKILYFTYDVYYDELNPDGIPCIGLKLNKSIKLPMDLGKLKELIYQFGVLNLSQHAVVLMNYVSNPMFGYATNLYEVKKEIEGVVVGKPRQVPGRNLQDRKKSYFR